MKMKKATDKNYAQLTTTKILYTLELSKHDLCKTKVINWCLSIINKCFVEKDKITNNDIALDFRFSKCTIDFTNHLVI